MQAEQIFERLMSTIPDRCFKYANGNSDKFAACMEQNVKLFQKEASRWELRNAFAAAKLSECIKSAKGNADSIKKCEHEAETTLKGAQEEFEKATRA
jgi:ABC-type transport system involved in cytochrome bd biosynthesis fused ATPase/permease subunit